MPPLGFERIRENGMRKIIVNEKGKLLRQAFYWKAEDQLSNEEIRQRLKQKGLILNHQRISEIFRNPFYCGLISHNMLEGRVIEGNQEKLVPKNIFLIINGLLDKNAHGYSINEENEAIPLKRFLLCDGCGKAMRGYIVQKKKIHYYKCSTVGCCNNKSAKSLHEIFATVLDYFNMDFADELITLVKKQTLATFNQLNNAQKDEYSNLQERYKELNKKIERLEERFIEEEIDGKLYGKYCEKYGTEKSEIEGELLKASKKVSNLDECINLAVDFASNMRKNWVLGDYLTKQHIQTLLFPDGIFYSKKTDGCRTTRINSVFAYIAHFKQLITKQKRGIPELNLNYASFAGLVAGAELIFPFR